ncbi:MAG: efflux RND transporter periplasmic adaptor subunit [Planctomycetota bacterium]
MTTSKSGFDWVQVGLGALAGCASCLVVGGLLYLSSGGNGDPADQAGGPPGGGGGPPPSNVRVAAVEVQTLAHRVPVIGRLRETRRVTVTSEIEGKLTAVDVDEGDVVTGGQTRLAQVDEVWAGLALEAAEAEVAAAEAELDQARRDLDQLEQLGRAGSARPREVEDQRTLTRANAARLDAAVAARDRARVEAQRAAVVAPFDGAVSRKLVEVGQWVEPGDGLIEMISVGELDAVIDVPERYVGAVAVGDPVEVRIGVLDASMVGVVEAVRPDGSTAARTFPVKVRLDDPDGRLRAGMSVVAEVPVRREAEYVTVPRDAVLWGDDGAAVWYVSDQVGPGPAAMPEPVDVLFGVGDRYAVRPLPGGPGPVLTPGTQVVIEGAERLFPTAPLAITPEPDAGTAPAKAATPPPAPAGS